jgi:hypothetical protein
MSVIGYILFWTGTIAWTIGNLMFLAVIFRYSTVWFFGCLWVPLADWIYFLLYMKQTWKPMLISFLGFLSALIGSWLVVTFAS